MKRLLEVMARLRDTEKGCPWDIEQTFATIAPYTIEEAYEVADAIAREDMDDLKGELGDLLFQVVFHSQMASEAGSFDFGDVAAHVAAKMIARHPHVFADQQGIENADDQTLNWEAQKAEERARKARAEGRRESALDGVALGLPALTRAEKLQKRAARVGFDFPDIAPVIGKIEEELDEVKAELAGDDRQRLSDEIGDLLFAVTNLARAKGIDPEAALRGTNQRFTARFHAVEEALANASRTPADSSLQEMDDLWVAAKKAENG
ncbi:nucleoside triphosphate pyrophosphohydrolase [Minwuia sp.]|uniref:nucleoside triphosphate pyrophosphohydrolase n=1 Tax=Minwuia sp. TaxID=2493630 RepID=UPI003A8D8978